MRNILLYLVMCGSTCYGCSSKVEQPTTTFFPTEIDSNEYESIFDPTKLYEVRHYYNENRRDSLFIYYRDTCIYRFFCRPESENLGYFVENSITIINDDKKSIVGDMLESDSILFVPLTMSFNGWIRIFTYDLKRKEEVLILKDNKQFDIYSRGHTYLKNGSVFCLQGIKVDKGSVKKYKIKNDQYELTKTYNYSEEDYSRTDILENLLFR